MTSLLDIYRNGHTELRSGTTLTLTRNGGPEPTSVEVMGNCHYSFDTNTRYVSYYVPEVASWDWIFEYLLNHPDKMIEEADKSTLVSSGNAVLPVPMVDGTDLKFSGRMYIYADVNVSEADRTSLLTRGNLRGLSIELRDRVWLDAYNQSSEKLAFVSHDSRDKDAVVRPLVHELGRRMCPVWYDEFSLSVGDSLSESISRGIASSKKCILILSPAFLGNSGWSKTEFQAIVNRHVAEGNVILPVWHQVSKTDIDSYSAFLGDIVALNTEIGLDAVADKLVAVLKRP